MEELVIFVLQFVGEVLVEALASLPFVEGAAWRRRHRAAQWRDLGPTLASSADTARRAAQRRATDGIGPASRHALVTAGVWAGLAWLLAGVLVGGLVTLAWPHTFLPHAALRLGNLVVAPVVAGILAEWIARHRADGDPDMDPDVDPRRHFWRAFWFTFGLVAARLVGGEH